MAPRHATHSCAVPTVTAAASGWSAVRDALDQRPVALRRLDYWGDEKFIRIHRSIIVNIERIRGLELRSEGEYEVVLNSTVRLRLSRRFRKRLQDRMGAAARRSAS